MTNYIKINNKDSVAVALKSLPAGTSIDIDGTKISLLQEIPPGHKFSLCFLKKNSEIMKYGNPIGTAKEDIQPGEWVHTHNLKTQLQDLLSYSYDKMDAPHNHSSCSKAQEAFFMGYQRSNKKIGVRNELWIIPTVGCVNNVATSIANQAQMYINKNLEAIVAFPHPYGCSQMGEDQVNSLRILADLINHPNAGGVLVLGLGCENNNIHELQKHIGEYDPNRVRFLVAQECENEIEEAISVINELSEYVGSFERTPISCSELVIGLKCGGSDGFSGITANPVVGAFSDLLISKGGSTILTEVPEMFGAETLLMNRCENEGLYNETVDLINDFKSYFTFHNQTIYENPSPGNKEGGISTLEDKSLGCVQKSGTALVRGVLSYGEVIESKGLNLLSAPGNDLVASTALAASGAHIVLFTTGRGTPFASPVPTVKIASNTVLSNYKSNWIDFDCGQLLENRTLSELSEELFYYVIKVASGDLVKAEKAGYHDMAIFKQGVTL